MRITTLLLNRYRIAYEPWLIELGVVTLLFFSAYVLAWTRRKTRSPKDPLEEALGPENPQTAKAVEALIDLYEKLGREDDAADWRRRLPKVVDAPPQTRSDEPD